MKIFNWVQKKLNQNVIKDGLGRNVKKTKSIAIGNNTRALLDQVALVDVLDGWRDGILTIGSFGFDPLKSTNEETELVTLENEDEGLEYSYGINNDDGNDGDEIVGNEEETSLFFTTIAHNFEVMNSRNLIYNEIDDDAIIEVDQAAKNRKQTTLAKLFYTNSDAMMKKKFPNGWDPNPNDKEAANKNRRSLAKKLIGEESWPIKKLNKLMKRMLKRKIHHVLDTGKASKSESTQSKATTLELLATKPTENVESTSLLEISETSV